MPVFRFNGSFWVPVIAPIQIISDVNPRAALADLYGQYLPVVGEASVGGTAGLLDRSKLQNWNSPTTNTVTLTDGLKLKDKIIWGDVMPPSVHNIDIELDNCLFKGGNYVPSFNYAVIRADQPRSGNGRLIVRDSEVDPQLPSLNRDGIRGNKLLAERNYVHDIIDGLSAYAGPTTNGGNAYSYFYGNVVRRHRYFFPDYVNGVSGTPPSSVVYPAKPADWEHNDGPHTDGGVCNGCKQAAWKGNLFDGTSVDLPGTGTNPQHPQMQAAGYANGSGFILTNTVGTEPDATVVVEENWFKGYNAHINIKANKTATVRNNRHFRDVYVDPDRTDGNSSSGYWIRYDQRAGNGTVITTDVWVDGPYSGQVLVEPRDRGVHFNV